ncbi:sensor histidine kinase ResE [Alicyclobacillus cellulosilyticus]|uniref:histidine kinase n=1 Tax=Alicyclobacillus cellulosilyticus TaxID=1003997 RepID=A0A917K1Y4_9BACL|nr:ATP-binding protein [Alicyclobacillus cellulosilyticus]GGI95491.1 sensor histidine kinase ResE [Alicyclobacillus cellulosilyticus]
MIRNSIVAKLWLTIVGMDVVVLVLLSVMLEQFFDNYVYQLQSRQLLRLTASVETLAEKQGERVAREVAQALAEGQHAQIRFLSGREGANALAALHPEERRALDNGRPVVLRTVWRDRTYVSVYARLHQDDRRLLQVSQEVSVSDADIARMRNLVILATCFGVLLATGLAFVVSKNLSRPLLQMNEVAEKMAKGQFDVRIDVATHDEVGRLGRTFNQLANDLKGTIALLSNEKAQLASILSSLADGVIATNSVGQVTLANPPALAWLFPDHRGAGHEIGVGHEPVRPFALPAPLHHLVQDVLREARILTREVSLGGRTVRVTLTPLRDSATANLRGVVAVLRDVTEERRLERLRRDLIANVSHELRTPLSMLQGYTEALLDDLAADPEQRRELTEIIHDETLRMRRLVNDLLDLAQLESGHLPMVYTRFRLDELLKRVDRKFQALAQERKVTLSTRCPVEPCEMEGDVGRLEQVFTNLLDNALRHTPPGGRIDVTLRPQDDRYEVEVADTGTGIPEEDLPYIWERFYKADKARTRGNSGTGLGLAITRHIVLAHGGDVRVQSTVGQGSVFTVMLPKNPRVAPLPHDGMDD